MKNRPVAGGSTPRPPSVIRLNYSTLLLSNTSPNLDIFTFSYWLKPVADLENFGGGDDKIYEHKLRIISKFCMFMINVLDLAQTCWGYF